MRKCSLPSIAADAVNDVKAEFNFEKSVKDSHLGFRWCTPHIHQLTDFFFNFNERLFHISQFSICARIIQPA